MNTDVRVLVLNPTGELARMIAELVGDSGARDVVIDMASLRHNNGASAGEPSVTYGTLTQREREVGHQIRTGKSNREIARALCISERTVETHVAAIFRKLGVNSRVQIATHPIIAA